MYKIIPAFFAVLIIFIFASCSGSSKTPVSDSTETAKINSINSSIGEVLYQVTQARNHTYNNTTTISLTSIKEPHIGSAISIVIAGNTIGEYPLNDDTYIRLLFADQDFKSDNGTGSIRISEYGSVKQTITGTFTGTFKNAKTNEIITVTAGNFNANRLTDITR